VADVDIHVSGLLSLVILVGLPGASFRSVAGSLGFVFGVLEDDPYPESVPLRVRESFPSPSIEVLKSVLICFSRLVPLNRLKARAWRGIVNTLSVRGGFMVVISVTVDIMVKSDAKRKCSAVWHQMLLASPGGRFLLTG
jgi:hypothetical protein